MSALRTFECRGIVKKAYYGFKNSLSGFNRRCQPRFPRGPFSQCLGDKFFLLLSGDFCHFQIPLLGDPAPVVRGVGVWALSRLVTADEFARLYATHQSGEDDTDVQNEWQSAMLDVRQP